jgi:hypothetical protein
VIVVRDCVLALLSMLMCSCGPKYECPCSAQQPEAVGSAAEQGVEPQPTTGKTHTFRDNWGEPGCAARGEPLTLRGRVRVEPFRKGTSGALLDEDGGEAWVLTYRAQGVLLQLDGAHVEVRGRACDKQGEALSGKHFDLESLVELRN